MSTEMSPAAADSPVALVTQSRSRSRPPGYPPPPEPALHQKAAAALQRASRNVRCALFIASKPVGMGSDGYSV